MSTYRDAKREDNEALPQKADPALEPMPCTFCKGMSTRGQLSAYGARCFRCYQAYCSAHIPRPAWMQKKP